MLTRPPGSTSTRPVSVGSASRLYTHGAGLSWTEHNLEFEASGSSTTLVIQSANQTGEAFGALIDGVRVVKINEEAR